MLYNISNALYSGRSAIWDSDFMSDTRGCNSKYDPIIRAPIGIVGVIWWSIVIVLFALTASYIYPRNVFPVIYSTPYDT